MNNKWVHTKWLLLKMRKRALHEICRRLYRENNSDISKSMIITGAGRSGTTWLASIIASQLPCRVMFEPFHSEKVCAFSQFHYFQYMRPEDSNPALWSYTRKVLTGNIRNPWIDREVDCIYPQYRLIKEIRANLFLKWLHLTFPEVPLLFIIRHPCAVVLSRLKAEWATDSDMEAMLAQPQFVDDFLSDKMDVIQSAKTDEEKHAVIWCIQHLVPTKQFQPDELQVLFYENLCLQPEVEIPKIFQAVGQDYQDSVLEHSAKPSTMTARNSAIMTGEDKVRRWKEQLSEKQIDQILAVVRAFELDYIYGNAVAPRVETL